MFVDEGGALWLSNPWLVLIAIVGCVALIVWCHRWLETGAAPLPRGIARAAGAQIERPRTLRQKAEARSPMASTAPFRARSGLATRRRLANRSPRNAA